MEKLHIFCCRQFVLETLPLTLCTSSDSQGEFLVICQTATVFYGLPVHALYIWLSCSLVVTLDLWQHIWLWHISLFPMSNVYCPTLVYGRRTNVVKTKWFTKFQNCMLCARTLRGNVGPAQSSGRGRGRGSKAEPGLFSAGQENSWLR